LALIHTLWKGYIQLHSSTALICICLWLFGLDSLFLLFLDIAHLGSSLSLKRLKGMNSVRGFRYDRPDQIDSIKEPGFCFLLASLLFFLICTYTDRDILYYTYIHTSYGGVLGINIEMHFREDQPLTGFIYVEYKTLSGWMMSVKRCWQDL
jgi:hypothetical protein